MSTFFISYSRKDMTYAENLRKHILLLDSSHEVFLDLYNIKAGEKWKDSLESSITKSDFFILILSNHSILSGYVEKEIQLVRRSELKSGLRKLFVLRIDNVPIPKYLADYQVLSSTGNFVIDFFKLMDGIQSKRSYYTVQHEVTNDDETGYWVNMHIDAPVNFMKLVEMVEYRFDHEFNGSEYVDNAELILANRRNITNGFKIQFWTSEPILVFVVIYLKSVKQVTFEHRVTMYF